LYVVGHGAHEVENVLLDLLFVFLGHALKLAAVGVIVLTPGCPSFPNEVLERDGGSLPDRHVGFSGACGMHFDDLKKKHGTTGLIVNVLQKCFRLLTLGWEWRRGWRGGKEGGREIRRMTESGRLNI